MAPFLKKFFPSVYEEAMDTSTNHYCRFEDLNLTMFKSSLHLAALVASLGRNISMLLGGLIFMAGAAINGAAQAIWMLILGRILLGFGFGFSIQSVPLYVSEMAPHKHRGALNIVFQLAITIGSFLANLVNYLTPKIKGGQGWRVSLGIAGVPALFIFVSALFLPNTPISMLEKGETEKARSMLRKIRGVSDQEIKSEFRDLVEASEASKQVQNPWSNILKRQYRPQMTMAVLIPCFQQLTGINVVMFYASVLFSSIGFKSDSSLLSAMVTGVNVFATMLSIYGTDRWGRRFLFLEGGIQMLIFQVLVAALIGWKFGTSGQVNDLPLWYAVVVLWYAVVVVIFICMFVAGYAWSWGPLGWLVPSEIFPLEIRSAAQSITVSVNMIFTFLVAQLFLTMLCHMKFGLLIFFAFFVALMTLFIYLFLPETKNIPIEEMSLVWEQHWFGRRFVVDEDCKPSSIALV